MDFLGFGNYFLKGKGFEMFWVTDRRATGSVKVNTSVASGQLADGSKG